MLVESQGRGAESSAAGVFCQLFIEKAPAHLVCVLTAEDFIKPNYDLILCPELSM